MSGIHFIAEALLVIDRGKLIGGGEGNLDIARATLFHERELMLGQTLGLLDLAHHDPGHPRRLSRGAGAARLPGAEEIVALVDSFHRVVEVAHEVEAAELSVGEDL